MASIIFTYIFKIIYTNNYKIYSLNNFHLTFKIIYIITKYIASIIFT